MSKTQISNVIGGLRSYLRTLSRRRNDSVVTADDAHQYLTRKGVSQKQINVRFAAINSVLREPNFESVGSVASVRPAARYRQITAWIA